LEKRRVRTVLATLNSYVNTFHRPNADGQRIGWVELICCGGSLPGDGVNVLELLKLEHNNPEFHIQLTPTAVSAVLKALTAPSRPSDLDELKIMHDMGETFNQWWTNNTSNMASLEGIHITSVAETNDNDASDIYDSEDAQKHGILIKLDIDQDSPNVMTHEDHPKGLNTVIFTPRLADKKGVMLLTKSKSGIAKWKVRGSGIVDMTWKGRKRHRAKLYRRLTSSLSYPYYEEEDLD
jgi:hypothetical protein